MAATAQRMLQSKLSIFSVNFLVCHTDASRYLVFFSDVAKSLDSVSDRKGFVRGIYALKRIIHTPKHGMTD